MSVRPRRSARSLLLPSGFFILVFCLFVCYIQFFSDNYVGKVIYWNWFKCIWGYWPWIKIFFTLGIYEYEYVHLCTDRLCVCLYASVCARARVCTVCVQSTTTVRCAAGACKRLAFILLCGCMCRIMCVWSACIATITTTTTTILSKHKINISINIIFIEKGKKCVTNKSFKRTQRGQNHTY